MGVILDNRDTKMMEIPVLSTNVFKRHDLFLGNDVRNHVGVSYQPEYPTHGRDSPKIELLQPFWLAKALDNLGRHLGNRPGDQRYPPRQSNTPTPTEASIVTDRDTIMRLNFRHVLRGA